MNMEFRRKLPDYQTVREEYPLTKTMQQQKSRNDAEIRKIFCGEDNRLLLVIGPCSADRADAVLDYISRLRTVQEEVRDRILIVPRIYGNKPRTTGDGYMGMLYRPDPNGIEDVTRGIIALRQLHLKVLEETGFSGADELLQPENHLYYCDVLSYMAVGARSVENQHHRLIASGLDIPVGMKNPTSGDLNVMMNSIRAAQHPHIFSYARWEVESRGNPMAHAILRGSVNKYGSYIPNYHYEDLLQLCELYSKTDLQNPALIVDTNHSNSGKQWEQQPHIAREVIHSAAHSPEIGKLVKGLMIESYLEDGSQAPEDGRYGCSITDPCLGWEKTRRLIFDLAEMR